MEAAVASPQPLPGGLGQCKCSPMVTQWGDATVPWDSNTQHATARCSSVSLHPQSGFIYIELRQTHCVLRFAAKYWAASKFNMTPKVTQVACRRSLLGMDSLCKKCGSQWLLLWNAKRIHSIWSRLLKRDFIWSYAMWLRAAFCSKSHGQHQSSTWHSMWGR